LKQELSQHVVAVAGSPKTAAAVSSVTTAAGLGTVLNLIPGVMGFVVMGVGISLQLILRRKGKLESEKLELEIKILKRKEAGLPTRREAEQ
jgi:hypothetical protein